MRVAVIGLGLLGGSFALALKDKYPDTIITGVESSAQNAEKALQLGLADEIKEFKEAVASSDLIILATPVNIMLYQLPAVLDHIKEGAVVMDLGSTKEALCKAADQHPKRKQFVAAHPIAGTENSGPEAAFLGLLNKKIMILCDKEKSDPEAAAMIEKICQEIGMKLSYMDSIDHDLHLAYVSHLSHISSFALGITVLDKEEDEKNIFEMAGSGFSSTVRLAKSSPNMWSPIFTQNRKNISEALGDYIKQLQYFKEIIDSCDESASKELMSRANTIRKILDGIDNK